jgi:hypothetical protein
MNSTSCGTRKSARLNPVSLHANHSIAGHPRRATYRMGPGVDGIGLSDGFCGSAPASRLGEGLGTSVAVLLFAGLAGRILHRRGNGDRQ